MFCIDTAAVFGFYNLIKIYILLLLEPDKIVRKFSICLSMQVKQQTLDKDYVSSLEINCAKQSGDLWFKLVSTAYCATAYCCHATQRISPIIIKLQPQSGNKVVDYLTFSHARSLVSWFVLRQSVTELDNSIEWRFFLLL